MEADAGRPIKELAVDGGASKNDFIMQFQADLLDLEVVRSEIDETTALGAAYLAGLATGVWEDRAELASMRRSAARYSPSMDAPERERLLAGWREAVRRAIA